MLSFINGYGYKPDFIKDFCLECTNYNFLFYQEALTRLLMTSSFFLNWQNIINQQARARCANKLGWKKNNTRGNRLP